MVFAYSSRYPTRAKQKTEATSRVKVVSTRFDLSSFSAPDKKTQVQTYASYKPSLQLSSQNIPSRRIALIKLQAFHSFCLKRPTLHLPTPPIFPLNSDFLCFLSSPSTIISSKMTSRPSLSHFPWSSYDLPSPSFSLFSRPSPISSSSSGSTFGDHQPPPVPPKPTSISISIAQAWAPLKLTRARRHDPENFFFQDGDVEIHLGARVFRVHRYKTLDRSTSRLFGKEAGVGGIQIVRIDRIGSCLGRFCLGLCTMRSERSPSPLLPPATSQLARANSLGSVVPS